MHDLEERICLRFPKVLNEQDLDAIVLYKLDHGYIKEAGKVEKIKQIQTSNILTVLNAEMAMPITVNNEIFEIILLNNRGIVSKAAKHDTYFLAIRLTRDLVILALGSIFDPGMTVFELLKLKDE